MFIIICLTTMMVNISRPLQFVLLAKSGIEKDEIGVPSRC